MKQKIVITGPESSGKTTLTSLLAQQYQTMWIKEYAREYLEQINRPYELEDVLKMAKEQLKQEQSLTQKLTFLDTDLTVYAIWIKEKYNQEIDWITAHLKTANNKLYLLCDIDVEWEEDELREHPNIKDRKRLFQAYQDLLKKYKLPYHIISGDVPTRLKKCRKIIENLLLRGDTEGGLPS